MTRLTQLTALALLSCSFACSSSGARSDAGPPPAVSEPGTRTRVRVSIGAGGVIQDVDITPDGRFIAGIDEVGTVLVWHRESGRELTNLAHRSTGRAVKFASASGARLASAGLAPEIQVWDVDAREVVLTLEGHTRAVTCLATDPTFRWLVSGSEDDTVRLWDLRDGRLVQTFEGLASDARGVSIACDGSRVAAFASDGRTRARELRVWTVGENGSGRVVSGEDGDVVHDLEFHPTRPEQLLVVDGQVEVWDLDRGELLDESGLGARHGHWHAAGELLRDTSGLRRVGSASDPNFARRAAVGLVDRAVSEQAYAREAHCGVSALVGSSEVLLWELHPTPYWVDARGRETRLAWDAEQDPERWQERTEYDWRDTALLGRAGGSARFLTPDRDDGIGFGRRNRKWTSKRMRGTYGLDARARRADSRYVFATLGDRPAVLDLHECRPVVRLKAARVDSLAAISRDGSRLATPGPDPATARASTIAYRDLASVQIWRLPSGMPESVLRLPKEATGYWLSPDGARLAVHFDEGGTRDWGATNLEAPRSLRVYDLASGAELYVGDDLEAHRFSFGESGRHLHTPKGRVDLDTGVIETGWACEDAAIAPDRSLEFSEFVRTTERDGRVAGHTLQLLQGSPEESWLFRDRSLPGGDLTLSFFSPDGTRVVGFGSVDRVGYVLDCESGEILGTLRGHEAGVADGCFLPDGEHALTISGDGTLRHWEVATGRSIAYTSNATDWIAYTPEGDFAGSAGAGELLSMVRGHEVFAVDQFALKYNRPDRLLEQVGEARSERIDALRRLHEKRLRRAATSQREVDRMDEGVPRTSVLATRVDGDLKHVELDLAFAGNDSDLASYQVYVNDVPLYGANGKTLKGRSAEVTERVELNVGPNEVEISCRDRRGSESYRALIPLAGPRREEARRIYYLGFGVSRYRDSNLDLAYAHKDALDLQALFEGLSAHPEVASVHTRVLVDEAVTPDSIRAARELLADARSQDVFVLFVAGHGLWDTSETPSYYFLTHDTDLDDLRGSAANFERLEELLHGIAPRRKLFLLDTCESGEFDAASSVVAGAIEGARGVRSRGVRGLGLRRGAVPPRSWLRDRDRYLFNDLVRRSGAIVFSSSRGGELSYESEEYENGLFTQQVLLALSSGDADSDGDGSISTDELRRYVSRAVASDSGGAQNPVVDRDNLSLRFGLPLIGD